MKIEMAKVTIISETPKNPITLVGERAGVCWGADINDKALKVLVEAGVVRELMIENNEARYDIITDFHGHFKCERCGDIHNFSIRLDDLAYKGLGSYLIKQRDVYFKGVCPDCLENKTISQEDL